MEFNKAYNRQDFVKFLQKDFLPEDYVLMEESVNVDMTYSKQVVKLGYSKSLELVVYEIQHNSKNDARVSLSKEAFRILANEAEYRALVIFVPKDNNDNYRLSLIEITLEAKDDSSRITYCYSNPRRYSYLMGTSIEGLRTIDEYLLGRKSEDDKIKRVIDYEDLRNRFSVEKLATDFYKDLQNWFACALDVVRFPNDLDDPEDDDKYNAESIIRLITRLIFVWFLKQKNLVPKEFFDEKYIADNLLKDFSPNEQFGFFKEKSLESKYYKAILQNLFFAMLNSPITKEGKTELSERHFRKLTDKGDPSQTDFNNNKLMRYESMFKNPQLFIDLANQTVPFLNGGLFDCLDKKTKRFYLDGFSDKAEVKKALVVPDYLFFSDDIVADLSTFYNDKKKYNEHVTGIIKIFSRYNFTIEENTPFDKEVSLDPELLGKVFENLLASYNPETHTTARKQTGSFYTPREIVQYMVDESLIAYLNKVVGEELEEEYRKLLRYTDEDLNLTEKQKYSIMSAIYNCKVLDPACGSGAFPVGMLQQMVHILSQLDPSNEQWKQMVLDEAVKESRNAFLAETLEEREQRLNEINETFEDQLKNPDYKRKLYLIENCLYGVDIQSIAIQICKLRFFISLVVDQKTNNKPEDNFGIRPLPNLESKFVAANTLIGLDKKDISLFDNKEVKAKMQEMREINHKTFYVKHKAKEKHEAKIKEITCEITKLLEDSGTIGNKETRQLQTWDRFDQNSSSPFFDSEWMFGVKDGFDIVIGNPPYGAKFILEEKKYFKENYRHQNYQPESYLLFIEKGLILIKKNGFLSYIIPNTWLINVKLTNIRKHVFADNRVLNISHYHKSVFDAVVDTEVVLIQKGYVKDNKVKVYRHFDANNVSMLLHSQDTWSLNNGQVINIFADSKTEALIKKITFDSLLMSDIANVFSGVVPYEEGKGTPKQTRNMMKQKIYNSIYQIDSSYRPVIRGADINRYENNWDGTRWIKYGKNLAAPRKQEIFDSEKIIIRQTGDSLIATYDNKKFICLKNTHVIIATKNFHLKYILSILNSKLMNYYYQYLNPEMGEALAEVKKENVEKLVFKKANDQKPFIELVDRILNVKGLNSSNDTSKEEAQIDYLVYKLYNLNYDDVLMVDPQTSITREEYETADI